MKQANTHHLFVWILLLFPLILNAQSSRNEVHLRSGTLIPQENLQQFLSSPFQAGEIINGGVFRLIQFYQIPSEQDRQQLAANGVYLLDYYPYNTWLAHIPTGAEKNVLSQVGVRSVFPLPVESKIHEWLLTNAYPDYAWDGDHLILLVQVPENISPVYAREALKNLGIAPGEELLDGNQFFVRALPSEVQRIAAQPYINWVESMPDPGQPEDLRALGLHRSNAVASDHPMGRHYNGEGVNIQVRDDGGIGPHIDFQGRTNQNSTGGPGGGTHGDMVAGVFAGAGNLDPSTRGAAWGSFIFVTDYQSTFTDNTLSLHQNNGVMITNSSYSNGCNAGYTTTTQRVDNQTYANPSLLHMFSAGNSNGLDCNYGAGDQWGNITGGHKQGKNVMAVANLLPDGTLVGSSSRGPAHDGRIKPDVAANGNEQMSTDPFNGYSPGGGTSAAAPSTAGVVAQLYQAYKEIQGNGSNPPSALIKAIVMNTAEDYGNRGPDFRYGWGRINALRAVKVIEDGRYFTGSVAQGATNTHNIEVPPGVIALKVMTYWMDPAATPGTSLALVNDLDSHISGPDGVNLPWVPNHTPNTVTLNVPATRGVDHLNNVEQVQIDNPTAGTHVLNVNGFSVPQGPQEYFVIIEYITEEVEVTHPIGGEGFAPGQSTTIHWDAHGNFGDFTIHYSTDNGASWKLAANNISGALRAFDWSVPNELSGQALVRVSRGNVAGVSANPFSIIGVPSGLEIVQLCSTEMTLKWNEVPGANSYDVFLMGTSYMDSIATTDELFYTFSIVSPFVENWVSVRARTPDNYPGQRAIAIANDPGPLTCSQGPDLKVTAIPSLGGGIVPSCADTVRIRLEVLNSGITPQFNFDIGYQFAGQPMVTATITDTLEPNAILVYEFDGGYAPQFGVGQSILVKGFVGSSLGDIQPGNDTLYETMNVTNNQLINPPFTQAFETFGICANTNNCGGTICPLGAGWVNEQNFQVDDIDWRVNSGSTVSNNTGPSSDHNPGTLSGKYVYLEASNGCEGQEAILTSPCVFLGLVQKPVLSIWYHMYGSNMGELHVDIFDGETWRENAAVVIGDQGDEWKQLLIEVEDLKGDFFSFRIRGITGFGFTSDLAIDDISVFDGAQAPVAGFAATRQQVCPGDEVTLIDESEFAPSSWEWTISPSTVTYLNGSSSSSAAPQLSFNSPGEYDVSLRVENAYGADSLTKTVVVTATNGMALPVTEDFESLIFPPAGWRVDNPDESFTWEAAAVIGAGGSNTAVARVNNYQYSATGEEDLLQTFNVDLRTAIQPTLSFDYAYSNRSGGYYDEFSVYISDNCGQSFLYPVFQKAQADLQTTLPVFGIYLPNNASHWRRDTIDLSAFAGNTISVGFVNLTGNGNVFYLDNIEISDAVTISPIAYPISSVQEVCVGEIITLSDTSAGNNLSYDWDLGADASPSNRGFDGNFDAVFSTPGMKTVVLTVSNQAGSSSDTIQILVKPLAEADFAFALDGGFQTFTFENSSLNASTYSWDFGDGTSSQDSTPTHTYTQNGVYTVTMIATGECGNDTATAQINIDNVAIEGMIGSLRLLAYPNPASDRLTLEATGSGNQLLRVSLTDLRGRTLYQTEWEVQGNNMNTSIDVSDLAEGVYLLKLEGQDGRLVRRIMVQ